MNANMHNNLYWDLYKKTEFGVYIIYNPLNLFYVRNTSNTLTDIQVQQKYFNINSAYLIHLTLYCTCMLKINSDRK